MSSNPRQSFRDALTHRLRLWNCVFGDHLHEHDPGPVQTQSPFFQLPPELRDCIYLASLDHIACRGLFHGFALCGVGQSFVPRLPEICFASRRTLFESVRILLANATITIPLSDESVLQFSDFLFKFPLNGAGISTGANCLVSLKLDGNFRSMPQTASSLIACTPALRRFDFIVYTFDLIALDYDGINWHRPKTVVELQATYSQQIAALASAESLQEVNVICQPTSDLFTFDIDTGDQEEDCFINFVEMIEEVLPEVEDLNVFYQWEELRYRFPFKYKM